MEKRQKDRNLVECYDHASPEALNKSMTLQVERGDIYYQYKYNIYFSIKYCF